MPCRYQIIDFTHQIVHEPSITVILVHTVRHFDDLDCKYLFAIFLEIRVITAHIYSPILTLSYQIVFEENELIDLLHFDLRLHL